MSDRSNRPLGEIPEWLREGLAEPESDAREISVDRLRGTPSWRLLLDAALASTFLPKDLAPGVLEAGARREAERSVLDFAVPVQNPEGARWMLTNEARARAIELSNPPDLVEAAGRSAEHFADGVSAALRSLALAKPPGGPESLEQLENERVAVTLLGRTSKLRLPSLKGIEREVRLRRLLAGFERMTGTRTDPDGGKTDRVYGRESDVERLRKHVDVVPISGVVAKLARLGRDVQRRIVGSPPLVVWGTGGVGKTTLVAKFMLEHARAASDQYPFAYLDFERSTVSARDRVGLLIEMGQQIACQFEALAPQLSELLGELGSLTRRGTSPTGASSSELMDYQARFRDIVDEFLQSQENLFSRSRPLLLVFDTFEVVQYSAEDVKAIEDFVANFARSGEGRLWPRLRLVIAGRKRVDQFLGEIDEHFLGALDLRGAIEMLVARASDAGIAFSKHDARELAEALSRVGGKPNKEVHPLRLRLVGEILNHAQEKARADNQAFDVPNVVRGLIEDLSRPDSEITEALVNGFLVRRVLDHLVDPKVKALADPGMVVRVINPEVIMHVMARGTAKPSDGSRDASDSLEFKPWDVSLEEALGLHVAFEKEVTLIDRDADVLRFRQDVRREMLPVIRRGRPNRFRHLHQLAWDFFTDRADARPDDLASASEAVYHGLWLDDIPLERVDQYWRRNPAFQPKIDADEFESTSETAIYLRAKTGAGLSPAEIESLGSSLAWDWLSMQESSILGETSMDEAVARVRAVVGGDILRISESPNLAAVVARLFFRTGHWEESAKIAQHMQSRHRTSQQTDNATVSLTRTWVTVQCKKWRSRVGPDPEIEAICANGRRYFKDPIIHAELDAHATIAGLVDAKQGDRESDSTKRIPTNRWSSEPRILRLAILAGSPSPRLVKTYFEWRRQLPREERVQDSIREVIAQAYRGGRPSASIAKFYRQFMDGTPGVPEWFESLDALTYRNPEALLDAVGHSELMSRFLEIIAADHWDWVWPMQYSLDRWFKTNPESVQHILDLSGLEFSWGRAKSQADVSGADVAAAAIDSGAFLHLADVLTGLEPDRDVDRLPSSISGIAKALLHWDERCRSMVDARPDVRQVKSRTKARPLKKRVDRRKK